MPACFHRVPAWNEPRRIAGFSCFLLTRRHSLSKLFGRGRRLAVLLRAAEAEAVNAALVGLEHFHVEAAEVEARPRRRHRPRLVDDEAGDGREVVVLDLQIEQAL